MYENSSPVTMIVKVLAALLFFRSCWVSSADNWWVCIRRFCLWDSSNPLIAVICINSISAIVAILSNALVVAVIASKQQLRTLYNILLACMGATDLMVGMLVQPLFVVSEIKHLNGFAPFCALDTVVSVTSYGFCLASVGHLVLISVERYV